MKLIIGKPGTGKTKKILELSADKNIPILAESEARVERLLVKASGYGISVPKPILVEDLNGSIKSVIVDDIYRFFKVKYGVELDALSVNDDEGVEIETI